MLSRLSDLRAALLVERANMSDAQNVVFPHKLLKDFIDLYKKSTCLWDKTCPTYKMKHKKHEAISKLTELVQVYDMSATRVHVLRKIESLRACVRREYRKVMDSKRTATTDDEIYTPHLWYYNLLSFIFETDEIEQPQEKPKMTRTSPQPQQAFLDSETEEDSAADDDRPFDSSSDNYSADYKVFSNMLELPESSGKRYSSFEDEKSKRHCTEVDDEYDAIGINVAAKLRNLPESTRILAEKLINDVLYQAQMNGLTNATTITTPDPFK